MRGTSWSSTSSAVKNCAAELADQQEFQVQMNVFPVEEPSASFLAGARMRLQEALEHAEQHRAWYHRFLFDPTAWLRQMRFSPALAAVLVIVGFGGGLGTMYSALGGAGKPSQPAAIQGASIAGITSIDRQPNSEPSRFPTIVLLPESMQGSITDPKIQELLQYAAKSNYNSGVRLNSVDALAGKPDDPAAREALIYALRYDSNPGVRLKALGRRGALCEAGHSGSQCGAQRFTGRQQPGRTQRCASSPGSGTGGQQRAHGVAAVGQRRSQRLHSH